MLEGAADKLLKRAAFSNLLNLIGGVVGGLYPGCGKRVSRR